MDDLPKDVEIAFLIETNERSLEASLQSVLPDADISTADNFTGGAEIAAFVGLGTPILLAILKFITANRDRVHKGTLRIGSKEIVITNYSPDQIETLLKLPEFQTAVKLVRKK